MENASKALIMAASILLGVMIISVGVALFNTFSEFAKSTTERIEESKISEWNNRYTKYHGTITVEENGKVKVKPIPVTAHEIISLANHAIENNKNYELETQNGYNENTYYVQVQVGKVENFEKLDDQAKNKFLQENSLTDDNETKYYMCDFYEISNVTKRVMYIKFVEYKQ